MTQAHPTQVSVALSTCNGAPHLPRQLSSLAEQHAPPYEVVVRDDGSTDGTIGILERFAADAPFPVRLTTGANIGLAASLAEVLPRCSGDLVALCDQDDEWLPAKLSRIIATLERRPECSAAVSDGLLVDAEGTPRVGTTFEALGFSRRRQRQFAADPVEVLAFRSVLTGHAVVMRREVVEVALPFPTTLLEPGAGSFPDRWLSLVAAGMGLVAVIDEPLVRHRQHAAQQTGIDARRPVLARRAVAGGLRQLTTSGRGTRSRLEDRAGLLAAAAERTGNPSLTAAAAHLERRAGLPTARRHRPGTVIDELAHGRYRWSGGAAVAAADLVRPIR